MHAFRKAYTALTYKTTSSEYGKRAGENRAIGPQLLPNITTAAGGVPIKSGDRVIGAVGVSGTPGGGGGGEPTPSAPRPASRRSNSEFGDGARSSSGSVPE